MNVFALLKSSVFIAALLGSFGTLLVQIVIRYLNDRRYSKQVKYMILESCRRVSIYLEHMVDEPKEIAVENLESRIKGIEIIQQLLSEMQLNLIPSKDIFIMYRTRELIHEISDDLTMFRDNNFKLKQYEATIQALIIDKQGTKSTKNLELLEEYKKKENEHFERLTNDIKEYINILESTKVNYNYIKNTIFRLNR